MGETKRVDISYLEGKKPLAWGYKIFKYDWSCNGYVYADNGEVEGSIHTVTGSINHCVWRLHFCKNPLDCLKYYEPVQWNKFAKVSAYDEIDDNAEKVAARTLKIDKVLTWDEFIEEIKCASDGSGISDGFGINYGFGISNGHGISDGFGISEGSGISEGYGISNGYGINYGFGINYGHGISYGFGISNGYGISNGSGIRNGYGIRDGSGIRNGYGISEGYGINYGFGISKSNGVNRSMYCVGCTGISDCIFTCEKNGKRFYVFNKKVNPDRFNEIWDKVEELANGWYPNFTNAQELKAKHGNGNWEETPAKEIQGRSAKEAYADMPQELRSYIQSLPEYDEAIFKAITEQE